MNVRAAAQLRPSSQRTLDRTPAPLTACMAITAAGQLRPSSQHALSRTPGPLTARMTVRAEGQLRRCHLEATRMHTARPWRLPNHLTPPNQRARMQLGLGLLAARTAVRDATQLLPRYLIACKTVRDASHLVSRQLRASPTQVASSEFWQECTNPRYPTVLLTQAV